MGFLDILVLISSLAFIGAGAVVGVRLMRLASRTKAAPEWIVGFSLFLLAAVSWPIQLLVSAPEHLPEVTLRPALAVGAMAMALGWAGVFVFTWHVFRPAETWARLLAGVGVGVELGAGLAAAVRALGAVELEVLAEPSTSGLVLLIAAQVAYGWTAIEAFRYQGLLRRRVSLGLADPLVVNRFGLWGWTGVFAAASIAPSTVSVVAGTDPATPFNYLVVALCGLASAGALTLAFLPPPAYVRFIRGAVEEVAAPADAG